MSEGKKTVHCQMPTMWDVAFGKLQFSLVNQIDNVQYTGLDSKAVSRLREHCRHVEAEVESTRRNKVHQTWERPKSQALLSWSDVTRLTNWGLISRNFKQLVSFLHIHVHFIGL